MANVTPVYKKGNRSDKDNYLLVFYWICQKKIKGVYENKCLHFLSIFFLGINAGVGKNAVLNRVNWYLNWEVETVWIMGRLLGHLKDLSKAFNCLNYLLIAKLKAYNFDNNSFKLVHENLLRRFQRTKIANECSSWKEIMLVFRRVLY